MSTQQIQTCAVGRKSGRLPGITGAVPWTDGTDSTTRGPRQRRVSSVHSELSSDSRQFTENSTHQPAGE